jgi:hypothetical protein
MFLWIIHMHVSCGEAIFTSRGWREWKIDCPTATPGNRSLHTWKASKIVISINQTAISFLLISNASFEFDEIRLMLYSQRDFHNNSINSLIWPRWISSPTLWISKSTLVFLRTSDRRAWFCFEQNLMTNQISESGYSTKYATRIESIEHTVRPFF